MWPPASGERISKYRLERLLGAGGMGSVYLARDLDLDRDVAIKFITDDRADDDGARRRLIREARAAAALDHPNICAVHDVIVDPEGRACIVMQYVEGETLAERLRAGPMDKRTALMLTSDVAGALAAAHKRGIIHRDIKPQNIIITPGGRAKLLDFGIARLDETSTIQENLSTETRLTAPGRLAGTPAYMSPEQAQQKIVDGRSDLFSLGAVLFECLTGRLPFDGTTPAELYGQILHVHPPPVSAWRPGLTEREDQLCRRLLAKHPDDRFTSADELLGALRVLVPDTAHASPSERSVEVRRFAAPRAAHWLSTYRGYVIIAALAVGAAVAVWYWQRPQPLPAAPPDAARWYARGTELMRDGAYHSARLALQEAIHIYPQYALAYARIAEAHSELDESTEAQTALLKVDQLVENRARLETEDRLRLDAIRALFLRDTASAVNAYTQLAERRPSDAGVWLDLGRAQEAVALPTDARGSYERAIAIDRQYAPAHLRRAAILSQQGNRDEAFKELDEAERLYRVASNAEGEAETLLRRGTMLVSLGQVAQSRAVFERAAALATGLRSKSQEIRARLRLGNLTASEGRFGDAQKIVMIALDDAMHNGLEAVAAEGLLELSNTFTLRRRHDEADAYLTKAVELADKRGARRTAARAQLQRASLMLELSRPAEALTLARAAVEVMRARHYRRWELTGLNIIARAHESLQQYGDARRVAEELLEIATREKDERHVAAALESLAGQATAVGELPEAVRLRTQLEAIHRRQQDNSALPYDLVLRADLLISLGRHDDAVRLLDEIDAGAARGIEAFTRRKRRAALLRAIIATVTQHFDAAARAAGDVVQASPQSDSTLDLAVAVLAHANARLRRPPSALSTKPTSGTAPPVVRNELDYLNCATRFASGDASGALLQASEALGRGVPSYELEFRLAALAAAAASRVNREAEAKTFAARAAQALQRLRAAWKQDAATYEERPDIARLRREAGLNSQS